MRNHLLWAILVIATALVEVTLLQPFRLQGVLPDLILLLVIYAGIAHGEERAMFVGTLGGLFQDVTANTGVGHHVLCLVITGFLVGRLSRRLVTDHPAVKAGLVFCMAVLHGLIFTAISYVQNPHLEVMYTLTVSVVPGAFYTALVTPLIFFVLERTEHFTLPIQGSNA